MSQDTQQQRPRQFVSVDPYGTEKARYDFESDVQVLEKIEISYQAYTQYRQESFESRKQKLIKLAEILEQNVEEDAKIISQEVGKPYQQSLGEVKKSASHCRYYAETMESILTPQVSNECGAKQEVLYEPTGIIYIITPFNFPHWQIFKPVAANLALGNTVIVRTSDSTPLVGLNIEKRFEEAGFKGVYQNIFSAPQQLETIISNKHVKGISFTGSSGAGSYIASIASKYLKKSVMELGGSDPFIVLEDADVNLAVDLSVRSRLLNCGQVCIASKRFLINEKVYDKYLALLVEKVKAGVVGYPMEEGIQMGPMARPDLLENIEKQVKLSISQGAKLIYGGERIADKPGNFFQPTILEIPNSDNIAFDQEFFGPVFLVFKVKSNEEAVEIANNSEYGLGSVVIGQNIEQAQKVANQLETGMSTINDVSRSDSKFPFGGCKKSGYGRECGKFGITEFANVRLRWINQQV